MESKWSKKNSWKRKEVKVKLRRMEARGPNNAFIKGRFKFDGKERIFKKEHQKR